MNNNNQLIASQLQTLATAIPTMEDADLLPAVLDSCAILLEEVRKRHKPLDQMDPFERSELTGGYTLISTQVAQFAEAVRTQLGIDTVPAGDPMQELTAEMEHSKELDAARKSAQVQLDAVRAENDKKEIALEKQSQELTALRNFQTGLERELAACSEEVIAQQVKANEVLFNTVAQQRAQLKAARDEAEKQEEELERIRSDIAAVEEKIDGIPGISKQLLSEYDQRSAHLARLEKAKEDCSVEKQFELECRIKSLTPVVEELETATRKLSAHCKQLEDAHTDLDRQNQTLQTNLLQYLHNAMAELQQLMGEHQEVLRDVKHQADTLRTNLTECEKLRRDYADWFDASRTPLDAMLAELDAAEHQNLRQTLDIAQCNQVRQLYTQVRDGLQKLDKVISACAEAARVDQRNLERRVVAK